MMKRRIKQVMMQCCPGLYHGISSYRFFRYCRRRFGRFQCDFAKRVYGNTRIEVLSGPFRGLRYTNKIVWGPITPKWVGTYEAELQDCMEEIIETGYATIIDVGAAEGYYAVGLAWKCPGTSVVAYDIDPIARRRQRELADINAVENLEIRKYCDHSELTKAIRGRALVISDIEGFEAELLDPVSAPVLKQADILVEIHPHKDLDAHDVESRILERFEETHRVVRIVTRKRDLSALSPADERLQKVDPEDLLRAMDECRNGPQSWLWMKAEKC